MSLSVTGPRVAEEALTITARGGNLTRRSGLRSIPYGLELIVTDPAILPGDCEPTESAELTRIDGVRGGGALLTYQALSEGTGGRFTLREPYEPAGSGPLEVCAYSEWQGQDAAGAQTQTRIGAAPVVPRALARPKIHRSGQVLTCSRGRFSGAPTNFTYRWRVDAARFAPARRGAAYRITRADTGHLARCEVIARGPGGSGEATSAPFRIG